MEMLTDWIKNLVFTVIIISSIDVIAPDSSVKNMIKMITSIILMTVILKPLSELIS